MHIPGVLIEVTVNTKGIVVKFNLLIGVYKKPLMN